MIRLSVRFPSIARRSTVVAELLADLLLLNPANMMRHYIEEAVNWMIWGGKAHNNFIPLLWIGLRDWETSSASLEAW
jgi:hypothetical protein